MSSISKFRDDLEGDLSNQIASLKKEVAALRSTVRKQGGKAYDDASETMADLIDSLLVGTKDARKQLFSTARHANDAARDNPVTTAVVGLAAVGLIAALFLSARR